MKVNGSLINYYFHCKRQCYLSGNRLNLEDNSETVKVGKAIHEQKLSGTKNSEVFIDNIRIDKLTDEYVTEIKKSDADIEAAKWQLIYYLKVLKDKGIIRKGKLECIEKNKTDRKIYVFELSDELEDKLELYVKEIKNLVDGQTIPKVLDEPKCNNCSYYEYCYI